MLGIIDYGVGNIFSLYSSFAAIGEEAALISDPDKLNDCDRIILPGVGAFSDAVAKLRDCEMDTAVLEQTAKGKPLLGICLGMQLLFEKSYEYGEHSGLGLIHGSVVPMKGKIPNTLLIPHIGWNALNFTEKGKSDPLFKYTSDGDCVYFVHSFYADGCEDSVTAVAEYGIPLTASVSKDNVFGAQFHPEKSGNVGLKILKAFCEIRL